MDELTIVTKNQRTVPTLFNIFGLIYQEDIIAKWNEYHGQENQND